MQNENLMISNYVIGFMFSTLIVLFVGLGLIAL